jgi:hypothetical protein
LKDAYYFPHDANARQDEKILKLIKTSTWFAYGLYWAIIERLHEAGGWLEDDPETIAFGFSVEPENIRQIVHDFGLFVFKEGKFSSHRVLKNILNRKSKSQKGRENAMRRWKCDRNAIAMPSQCDPNAIKERKGKERKGKEIKEKEGIAIPFDLSENAPEILDWFEYKKQKGQTYKPKGLEAFWRALRLIPKEKRREAVDHSMANNWSGLFQKNGGTDGNQKVGAAIVPGKYDHLS